MDDIVLPPTRVLDALRERKQALESERSDLATRVRSIEGQLAELRLEAEHCASEAIQLQALIGFYETGGVSESAQPRADLVAPDSAEVGASVRESATAGTPYRKTTAQWTLAWRDEAVSVLQSRGEPLHYRELYRSISARGFTFGGKSPEASFLASLSRDQATFVGVGRGCYWLAAVPTNEEAMPAGPKRRPRRPKPIGKAGGRA